MQVGLPWLKIESQNKESKTVSWFYNDHKDEKRYDVIDNVIDFYTDRMPQKYFFDTHIDWLWPSTFV